MPLLSTRAAASATGYGENITATNVQLQAFENYGVAPYAALYTVNNAKVSPDGTAFYVAGQSKFSSQLIILTYSRNTVTGELTYVSTTTLGSFGSSSTAIVTVTSDSKNLYVSVSNNPTSPTEATNAVYQFSINSTTKDLTALSPAAISVGTGTGVTGIVSSADGKFIYVGSSTLNKIYIYSRNTTTGLLTYSNVYTTPVNTLPFAPLVSSDNAYLYSPSSGTDANNAILQYSRNIITGDLSPLSPEGVAGGVTMRQLNFVPSQYNAFCASTDGKVYIYSRNASTGKMNQVGYQFGSIFSVTFSADDTIMLGANTGYPSSNPTGDSVFMGSINPSTGEITQYSSLKFTWVSQYAYLVPSPSYDDYYSMGTDTIYHWKLEAGYLKLIESSAPNGSRLPISPHPTGVAGLRSNTFLSLSPDGKSLYGNGYWDASGSATYTPKGSQFDIATGTGIPARATSTPTGTQQGAGASVISSDSMFFYQIDTGVNPIVIRQYSRNTSTGNLTSLSTPTVNLPTLNPWSSTVRLNQFGYPVLSPDGQNLYVSYVSSGLGATAAAPYIIQFSRNTVTGLLTLIGTVNIGSSTIPAVSGSWGPEICLHPNGNFAFCLGNTSLYDQVVFTFSRNPTTGVLTQISSLNFSTNTISFQNPYLCMTPDGSTLYAVAQSDYYSEYGKLVILSVNSSTGTVTITKTVNYRYLNLYHLYRMLMLPNGKGIITFFYNTNYTGLSLIKVSASGDLSGAFSKVFEFKPPIESAGYGSGVEETDVNPNAIAISADSTKLYLGGQYITFGTLIS